jgi:hypothetical protein
VFEVAVRTESPAVEAGPAPEIDVEMRHPSGTLLRSSVMNVADSSLSSCGLLRRAGRRRVPHLYGPGG